MVAVLQPLKHGKVIPIDRAVVMVGRGSDCDAIITDSQKISRRHCCLVQVDNSYFIRDLGSMNGIWVNGKRVTRECPMALGDKVQIGDVEFQFHPNARIESKRTVVSDVEEVPEVEPIVGTAMSPKSLGGDVAEVVADQGGGEAALLQSGQIKVVSPDDLPADDVKPISKDEFEVIDDVIPLENDDAYLLETNEVEIIDEPIVDDEIVEAELVEAEIVEAEIVDDEFVDAEVIELTSDDEDNDDEILIFED